MSRTDISRFLPNNEYQAAIGANNPSASNVFATINDLGALGNGIYGGSDTMQAGVTNVSMPATTKLQFDSANPGPGGLDGLLTIDSINNRIGMGTANPAYGLHMLLGDAYFSGISKVAIGTTPPTAGYRLWIATDDSDGNNHRGQRITLGGTTSTASAQIAGIEIRSLNTKTATGTNNYRAIDTNFTGGATVGTYNLIGMRVKFNTFTNLGSATINRYIGEFLDGNEGLGKVLADVTGSGLTQWVDPNTLVTIPNTIYSADDTLAGNRIVSLGSSSLTFSGLGNAVFNNGNFTVNNIGTVSIATTGPGGIDLTTTGVVRPIDITASGDITMTAADIILADGTEGTIGHVWTQSAVTGEGGWAALPTDANTNIYNTDGTTGAGRAVGITDNLTFGTNLLYLNESASQIGINTSTILLGSKLQIQSTTATPTQLNFLTQHFDGAKMSYIDNGARVYLGIKDTAATFTDMGLGAVNIKTGTSNGSFTITNATTDGTTPNTTAHNTNFVYTTRDSAGNIAATHSIFVRNRNVTAGSVYGVAVYGAAIQTENPTGFDGKTIVSTRNRHTSGTALGVFHVENRDKSQPTTMVIDAFGQGGVDNTLVVRSSSTGTGITTTNWVLKDSHAFTHNFGQLATGDFIIRGLTDANLMYIDASLDRVGIGTATPNAKLEVNGSLRLSNLTTTPAIGDVLVATSVNGDVDWATPDVASVAQTYTVNNPGANRTIDYASGNANITREVLATLIVDLQTSGIIS